MRKSVAAVVVLLLSGIASVSVLATTHFAWMSGETVLQLSSIVPGR